MWLWFRSRVKKGSYSDHISYASGHGSWSQKICLQFQFFSVVNHFIILCPKEAITGVSNSKPHLETRPKILSQDGSALAIRRGKIYHLLNTNVPFTIFIRIASTVRLYFVYRWGVWWLPLAGVSGVRKD